MENYYGQHCLSNNFNESVHWANVCENSFYEHTQYGNNLVNTSTMGNTVLFFLLQFAFSCKSNQKKIKSRGIYIYRWLVLLYKGFNLCKVHLF